MNLKNFLKFSLKFFLKFSHNETKIYSIGLKSRWVRVSRDKKKKESELKDDSNSISEDLLQVLADASADDEAEFLDALSEDISKELSGKETTSDSKDDLKDHDSKENSFLKLDHCVDKKESIENSFDEFESQIDADASADANA